MVTNANVNRFREICPRKFLEVFQSEIAEGIRKSVNIFRTFLRSSRTRSLRGFRWDVRKNYFSQTGAVERLLITIRDHDEIFFRTIVLDFRTCGSGKYAVIASYSCAQNINLTVPSAVNKDRMEAPVMKMVSKVYRVFDKDSMEKCAWSFIRKMRR